MKLNIPVIGQRDLQWSQKKLGTSNTTIGDYGCVITAMAMLCRYYGKDTDPARLNDETVKVGGFVDGNLYVWQSISKVYSDIRFTSSKDYPLNPAPVEAINAQIDANKPVLCWVDLNPNQPGNQMHFIILIGREGGDYWINDPWHGDQVMFSTRYGDPIKGILGHRFYTGTIPQVPTSNGTSELQAELEKANNEIKRIGNLYQETLSDIEGFKAQIITHENQLKQMAITLGVAAEPAEIMGQITKLVSIEDKLRDCQKERDDSDKKASDLTQELEKKEKMVKDTLEQEKALQRDLEAQIKQSNKLVTENKQLLDRIETLMEKEPKHKNWWEKLLFWLR